MDPDRDDVESEISGGSEERIAEVDNEDIEHDGHEIDQGEFANFGDLQAITGSVCVDDEKAAISVAGDDSKVTPIFMKSYKMLYPLLQDCITLKERIQYDGLTKNAIVNLKSLQGSEIKIHDGDIKSHERSMMANLVAELQKLRDDSRKDNKAPSMAIQYDLILNVLGDRQKIELKEHGETAGGNFRSFRTGYMGLGERMKARKQAAAN